MARPCNKNIVALWAFVAIEKAASGMLAAYNTCERTLS